MREVAIFVYRGDRFLVTHRANDGHWNVVAGQVEDGESYESAAARELMEEAQLAAPLLDLGAPQQYEIVPLVLARGCARAPSLARDEIRTANPRGTTTLATVRSHAPTSS